MFDQKAVEGLGPYVERFMCNYVSGWREPASGGLTNIWDRDAVMTHPEFEEPVVGSANILLYLDDILTIAPDLTVEPVDVAWNDPVLFVRFRGQATFNGHEVSWEGVDRFVLREGVAVRGDGYFDTTPMRQALGAGK